MESSARRQLARSAAARLIGGGDRICRHLSQFPDPRDHTRPVYHHPCSHDGRFTLNKGGRPVWSPGDARSRSMFHLSDLYLLAPEASMAILALAVMMVDLFIKRRIVTVTVGLAGLLVPLGFAIAQAVTPGFLAAPHYAFSGMLVIDPYAVFFEIVFIMIAAVMTLASYSYVGKYVKADGEFYTLMLFAATGAMFMASTNELITIYISLELTSIPLYVMAGLLRTGERSTEAAVKYVLLGAMSSAILLYGFALLYGLTGTTDLAGIARSVGTGVQNGNVLILIADVLILAGFGFKISAVPFHMWAPDIYEGAPTPAT